LARDDNRAGLSDGKDECTPAIRNRAADGYPERLRMAALEFRLAETLGGTAKPGWSPRKGRPLSSFLGASGVALRSIHRFFFQLRIRSFMPRWCFRCVLLRAKETLRLTKLDRSSHGATANGSSGFVSVAITKPTKVNITIDYSGSHAGTTGLPNQKVARTRLGTRSGRSSGARLENGRVIPRIPHRVRREPSNRPREMIRRNRAGRESLTRQHRGVVAPLSTWRPGLLAGLTPNAMNSFARMRPVALRTRLHGGEEWNVSPGSSC
jgi:hypothetical protein